MDSKITNISRKWPFILTGFWVFLTMGLGGWWLYLIVKLGRHFNHSEPSSLPGQFSHEINFVYMAKWEGLAFIVLLLLVSVFLLFIYLQDIKKAKAMQAFFASVTHELRTPLASVRLQAEVMKDLFETSAPSTNSPDVMGLVGRLIEDTQKLENELEKILQLSRMERGGNLNPVAINLGEYVQNFLKKEQNHFAYDLQCDRFQLSIWADEYALRPILRNLIENTYKYGPSPRKKIIIKMGETPKGKVFLQYEDQGAPFTGNFKKLGTLFYTHNTRKGTGIGLYLIKKLMERMNGNFLIKNDSTQALIFTLIFPKAPGES